MCGCCRSDDEDKDKSTDSLDDTDGRSPMRNRGCTDIPALIMFLVFIGGMVYISVHCVLNGHARRLVFGTDSYGNTCGQKNAQIANVTYSGRNLTGKNYVFYMNILYPQSALSICIDHCPSETIQSPQDLQKLYESPNGARVCDYSVEEYLQKPSQKSSFKGPCPVLPVYKSSPTLFRCIPDMDILLYNLTRRQWNDIIDFLNESGIVERVLSDLYTSWREMLGLCFLALGLGLIVSLLIRFVAGIIIWVLMVTSAVASLGATGVMWWVYVSYKYKLDGKESLKIKLLTVEVKNEEAFLGFAVAATVFTSILLLVMIVLRKRVKLAVALFNESGKCLTSIPCLFLQPILTFIILVVFFIYWCVIVAYMFTSGTPVVNADTGFVKFEDLKTTRYLWWYWVVALIWVSEFILACEELVIASAVSKWYFIKEKSELGCTVSKSICRLITRHIGSVALGSFVVTLVKIPRAILLYLQKKFRGQQNCCISFCLKCCACCLWCLEKCIKYLNRNAYVLIAIEGRSFCPSARRAFSTLVSNVLRVAAINGVGDFILFLAKVTVMAGTALAGVVLLKERSDLHYYAIPIILCCVFSYFIASVFFSVYGMVVDAMLLCFCEDCRINDGTPGKEYFMSTSLMEFVKDSSSHLDTLTRRKKRTVEDETESLQMEKTNV